jgi:hypothetical protein
MRYERTDSFKADWKRLDDEERALVRARLAVFNSAADDVAQNRGDKGRWPTSLRVHDIQHAQGVWSVTFNFSGPDLRATFLWQHDDDGPKILWRRIGGHGIYRSP